MRTGIQGRGQSAMRAIREIDARQRLGVIPELEPAHELEFWARYLTPSEAARALGLSRRVVEQQLANAIEG